MDKFLLTALRVAHFPKLPFAQKAVLRVIADYAIMTGQELNHIDHQSIEFFSGLDAFVVVDAISKLEQSGIIRVYRCACDDKDPIFEINDDRLPCERGVEVDIDAIAGRIDDEGNRVK